VVRIGRQRSYFTIKSEVKVMSSLYHQIVEKYAQALFLDMKSPSEETKSLLQQRLQELISFLKHTRKSLPWPWIGLHEKLLAKDQDAWPGFLLWAYQSPSLKLQEVKALSPFCDQSLYIQRRVSGAKIVIDPNKLEGVRVL
jgi:hypothetical protein